MGTMMYRIQVLGTLYAILFYVQGTPKWLPAIVLVLTVFGAAVAGILSLLEKEENHANR